MKGEAGEDVSLESRELGGQHQAAKQRPCECADGNVTNATGRVYFPDSESKGIKVLAARRPTPALESGWSPGPQASSSPRRLPGPLCVLGVS